MRPMKESGALSDSLGKCSRMGENRWARQAWRGRTSMLPKREWAEMTWADFSASDQGRWIAVLPLAATEQHGPHLPLGVDSFIAEAYLAHAHKLGPAGLPVTFLPIQPIGQ